MVRCVPIDTITRSPDIIFISWQIETVYKSTEIYEQVHRGHTMFFFLFTFARFENIWEPMARKNQRKPEILRKNVSVRCACAHSFSISHLNIYQIINFSREALCTFVMFIKYRIPIEAKKKTEAIQSFQHSFWNKYVSKRKIQSQPFFLLNRAHVPLFLLLLVFIMRIKPFFHLFSGFKIMNFAAWFSFHYE